MGCCPLFPESEADHVRYVNYLQLSKKHAISIGGGRCRQPALAIENNAEVSLSPRYPS